MQTKSTIAYLNKKYGQILRKSFLLEAGIVMAGAIFITNTAAAASAEPVFVGDFEALESAVSIPSAEADPLNITGNIAFEKYVTLKVDTYIEGNGFVFDGEDIGRGFSIINSTHTLNDITMQNFGSVSNTGNIIGGAIYNTATLDLKNVTFIENHIEATLDDTYGGAIYNIGTINNLTGKFLYNQATAIEDATVAYGGAIYNEGDITNITALFIDNTIFGDIAGGGAIYNYDNGEIKTIFGAFEYNFAFGASTAIGGAIFNSSDTQIDNIDAMFVGNLASAIDITGAAYGGAIANGSNITNINSVFDNNGVIGTDAYGGAIYNDGDITNINSLFVDNFTQSVGGDALGGAIHNDYEITYINGTFTGNNVFSTGGNAFGGAIYNDSDIGRINGIFTGNYTETNIGTGSSGGAIFNYLEGNISNIIADFIENTSERGGAIYNIGDITNINSVFENNTADRGGAIYNVGDIEYLHGIFTGNTGDVNGGAIYTQSNIEYLSGIFTGNTTNGNGGAIYNEGTINLYETNGLTLFEGNLANGISNAIHNSGTINISAGITDPEDGAGLIHIKDNITGGKQDDSGAYTLYGTLNVIPETWDDDGDSSTPEVGIEATMVMIDGKISGNNLTIENEILSFADGNVKEQFSDGDFNMNAGALLYLDADLANNKVDIINATTMNISADTIVSYRMLSDSSDTTLLKNIGANVDIADAYTNDYHYDYDYGTGNITQTAVANDRGLEAAIDAGGVRTFSLTDNISLTDSARNFDDYGLLTIFGNVQDALAENITAKYGDEVYSIDGNNINFINISNPNASFYLIDTYIKNSKYNASGGAIRNLGTSLIYNSVFDNNTVDVSTDTDYDGGGAIHNGAGGVMNIYSSMFTNNFTSSSALNNISGGAINNDGVMNIYSSVFDSNFVSEAGNKSLLGGAIANFGYTTINGSVFSNNSANSITGEASGGAIENSQGSMSITDSIFINNSATSSAGDVYGGAISNYYYLDNDSSFALLSIADTSFINNSVTAPNNALGGAIYNTESLFIIAEFKDVEFTGNTANGVSNAIYNDYSGALSLQAMPLKSIIFNDSITGNGTMSIGYNAPSTAYGTYVFNNDMSEYTGDVTLNAGTIVIGDKMGTTTDTSDPDNPSKYTNFFGGNFEFDSGTLDSANGVMDRFNTENWDTTNMSSVLDVIIDVDLNSGSADYFDNMLYAVINISGINILNPKNVNGMEVVVTDDGTDFTLDNSAKILYSDIYEYTVDDALLGYEGKLTITGTGFAPVAYTVGATQQAQSSNMIRIGNRLFNAGGYSTVNAKPSGDEMNNPFSNAWVDFYASSEDIDLSEITVENDTYHFIVGADTKDHELGKFGAVYSLYGGYVNSSQDYDNVSIDQNGFIIGGRAVLDKDKITSTFIANVGMNFVDASTSGFGDEDFETYNFTLANKTGMAFDMKDGMFTLTPSMTIGYHFIHTTDYTTASGNNIDSDGLHIFNFAPELRVDMNMDKYTPYAAVAYNFNADAGGDVKASGVLLPTLSADSYVEFKLGTSAELKENLSGYVEANATTGDVEGFGGRIGIKYDF